MKGIEGTFEVVGARAALAYFAALESAALSHGYLFSGPPGVGKKTFARRVAQSLLCETPKSTLLGYCDRCAACRLFAAGSHPDFVETEETIKIGEPTGGAQHGEDPSSRDLVRMFSLHGYRSRHRVVLLGDVAFATPAAANALLKFFEEPPAGVVVIVTTCAVGSLLSTIRSRLVELAFPPLSVAEVASVLRAEGVVPERAQLAAEVSLGSVLRARDVLDDGGSGLRDASFAWFAEAMRGGTPEAGFLRLDDRSLSAAEKRELAGELVEIVRVAARDWSAQVLAGAGAPLLAPDQRARLAELPPRSPSEVVAVLAATAEAQRLATTNVSAGLVLDYLRMQLSPRDPREPANRRPQEL
ncbi:MAG: AAA family ATPase [Candidatus Baltobacteraceae bacterium]